MFKFRVGYAHSCFLLFCTFKGGAEGDNVHIKEIVKKTEKTALEICERKKLELVEAEFVKEGGNRYLRIIIDKPEGVSIDDCEAVSRELEEALDKEDFIEEAYMLEVSSPGLDRILKKDFEYVKYKGRLVVIKLYKAFCGSKEFEGELAGLENGEIVIVCDDGGEMRFKKEDVAVCKLAVIL